MMSLAVQCKHACMFHLLSSTSAPSNPAKILCITPFFQHYGCLTNRVVFVSSRGARQLHAGREPSTGALSDSGSPEPAVAQRWVCIEAPLSPSEMLRCCISRCWCTPSPSHLSSTRPPVGASCPKCRGISQMWGKSWPADIQKLLQCSLLWWDGGGGINMSACSNTVSSRLCVSACVCVWERKVSGTPCAVFNLFGQRSPKYGSVIPKVRANFGEGAELSCRCCRRDEWGREEGGWKGGATLVPLSAAIFSLLPWKHFSHISNWKTFNIDTAVRLWQRRRFDDLLCVSHIQMLFILITNENFGAENEILNTVVAFILSCNRHTLQLFPQNTNNH